MIRRSISLLLVVLVVIVGFPVGLVLAHGANITYTTKAVAVRVIEIVATFDTGEPMRGAQVAIFAPDDPRTPWQTGFCDEQGQFAFTPDRSRVGVWEVQVRQSGHGSVLYVTIGEPDNEPDHEANGHPDNSLDSGNAESLAFPVRTQGGSYTPLQYVLMAGCVAWGFVGTALYFTKNNSQKQMGEKR